MTPELIQLLVGAGLAILGWWARHKGFLAPASPTPAPSPKAEPTPAVPAPVPTPTVPSPDLLTLLAKLFEEWQKSHQQAPAAPAPQSVQTTIPLNLQLQATATHAPQA